MMMTNVQMVLSFSCYLLIDQYRGIDLLGL